MAIDKSGLAHKRSPQTESPPKGKPSRITKMFEGAKDTPRTENTFPGQGGKKK